MPTPCCDPKCRACIQIVRDFGSDEDYIEYMNMLGKRSIRPKEREAMAKKRADQPYDPQMPPTTPHITEFPDLVDVLPDMAKRVRELADAIAPLDEERKSIQKDINALLDAAGAGSIMGDDWIAVRYYDTFTESLSPEKLLAAGVTLEQLQAGTEKKPKAGYVQIRERKVQS